MEILQGLLDNLTALDVYKRQVWLWASRSCWDRRSVRTGPVSYTHLMRRYSMALHWRTTWAQRAL